jgi:hypothetical protein
MAKNMWPASGSARERRARADLLGCLARRADGQAKREAYASLVEELRALGDGRQRAERETQAGFNAALLVAAHPAGKGKPPKDVDDAWKKLPEDRRKAIRAEWEAKADAVWKTFTNRRESLEADLHALAGHVPVRAGALRVVVEDRFTSTHRSTGRGADYARVGATITAEGLKGLGVEVSVESYQYEGNDQERMRFARETGPDGFRVVALVEAEVDAGVLKRLPGVPLREWVRLCWKLGCNPRVYNPYLPHGYEEKNGLDFFGNDLRTAGETKRK